MLVVSHNLPEFLRRSNSILVNCPIWVLKEAFIYTKHLIRLVREDKYFLRCVVLNSQAYLGRMWARDDISLSFVVTSVTL